jgi:hypothetical protein
LRAKAIKELIPVKQAAFCRSTRYVVLERMEGTLGGRQCSEKRLKKERKDGGKVTEPWL